MTREFLNSSFFNVRAIRDDLSWGVKIDSLKITDLADSRARGDLYDLWIREGVIVFEGLESVEDQLELSRVFGPLRTHPTRESVASNSQDLMNVIFEPEQGWLIEVDGDSVERRPPWHSDLIICG